MKRKKTYTAKPSEIIKKWYLIDAKAKILGRLAAKIAGILRGKDKPIFSPHLDAGDFCVVINAQEVAVTGNKKEDKTYFRHSGYPGGHKLVSLSKMLEKHPESVIRHAVAGMLPKGSLGKSIINKLKIYGGNQHPHQAQNPELIKE